MSEASAASCLDRLVDRLAARKSLHHATLRVEDRTGARAFAASRGVADASGRAMTDDTPFFIASIDKMMTATLILQLEEEGRIGLDDFIGAHLPERFWQRLHRLDSSDCSRVLTIRHLLSHTSGLPDWLEDRPKGGRSLVERVLAEGDRAVSDEEAIESVRAIEAHFSPRAVGERATRARYSDTNFVLLRLIAEHVTGESFGALLERRVIEPLGLQRTWVFGQTTPREDVEPAALWAGESIMDMPELFRSIRNVYSTTAELIAFFRGLLDGALFSSAETVTRMAGDWTRFGIAFDPAALRSPTWPIEYGLGMKRFKMPIYLCPLRPVPAVIGHTGSTGTWLFYCQAHDLFLAGCVDQVTAGPVPFRTLPAQMRCAQKLMRA